MLSKEYSDIVGPVPAQVFAIFDPNDAEPFRSLTRHGVREGIVLNLSALVDANGYLAAGSVGVSGIATVLAAALAGKKVAWGQHTTIDEDDTVVTGLAVVEIAVASLESDPILTCDSVTAVIGNQSGAPAAGSIQIKSWMPTGAALTTPIAATSFTKLVNWIAIGT